MNERERKKDRNENRREENDDVINWNDEICSWKMRLRDLTYFYYFWLLVMCTEQGARN